MVASIAPVRFLLPASLKEWSPAHQFSFSTRADLPRPASLPVAAQFFQSRNMDESIDLKRYEWPVDSAPPPWLPDQRATDVTECSDSVDGHSLLIRSYRAPDMIYLNGTKLYGYVMEAALQLGPNVRLELHGTHPSPQLQEQTLAIIRSIRVSSP